jgi:hypothetical protein
MFPRFQRACFHPPSKLGGIQQTFFINCVEKTFRQLKVTFYDNEGGSIGTSSSPSEWNFITPESMGEKLYEEVCK